MAKSERRLDQETYVPEPAEQEKAAKVLSFITAHEAAHGAKLEPRYLLAGADEHDQIEIPAAVHKALRQVLEAITAGKAVTVVPQTQLLTTQQAADFLGVSRPTIVKMIDDGRLLATVRGKRHRMISLDDLLDFRAKRRDAQYRALVETSVDYDEELEDPQVIEERLRRARAEVAAGRRKRHPE